MFAPQAFGFRDRRRAFCGSRRPFLPACSVPVRQPSSRKSLHWFKYEAYFTWVTGVCLLAVVYYLNAKVYLIDASIMALTLRPLESALDF